MSLWKKWMVGAALAVSLFALTPAAHANDPIYFDTGLGASGYGYVYETFGPNQPTVVYWYDAYGNWGVLGYQ